jgi:hypothetical protein
MRVRELAADRNDVFRRAVVELVGAVHVPLGIPGEPADRDPDRHEVLPVFDPFAVVAGFPSPAHADQYLGMSIAIQAI